MKLAPVFSMAALAVAALGGAVRADVPATNGVVAAIDFTPAGKQIALPTESQPTFYLPLPIGYEDRGAAPDRAANARTAPANEVVEHDIAVMLAAQHYFLMSKSGHPTVVLAMRWGYQAGGARGPGANPALRQSEFQEAGQFLQQEVPDRHFGPNGGNFTNEDIQRVGEAETFSGPTPHGQRFNRMRDQPQWYLNIWAMDFSDWLKHKTTLLWREQVMAAPQGRSFDEVLPAMLQAAGARLGR